MRYLINILAVFFISFAFVDAKSNVLFNSEKKKAIEKIVKDYLHNNPEVIMNGLQKASKEANKKSLALKDKLLKSYNSNLYNSKYDLVVGDPNSKLVLVHFFDVNCGYCRLGAKDLLALYKKNSNLRIIIKSFPVLGSNSLEAARVFEAIKKQASSKKFWSFFKELLNQEGTIGKDNSIKLAKELGLDTKKLLKDYSHKDINDAIDENLQLGNNLQIRGTPAYVINEQVIEGAVGVKELQILLDDTVKKLNK